MPIWSCHMLASHLTNPDAVLDFASKYFKMNLDEFVDMCVEEKIRRYLSNFESGITPDTKLAYKTDQFNFYTLRPKKDRDST